LGVEKYPFYDEIKNSIGKVEIFTEFIKNFFENYEENYLLCKEWVNKCHLKLLEKINNENSFLNTLIDGIVIKEKNTAPKKLL
jgi:hypothetical protein